MRKILVVEDDTTLRQVYDMILSTGPYVVEVAKNGEEALEKCGSAVYDLILLDLMMPVLDGVGFLEQFSGPDGKLGSKVIILSNLSTGQELTRALSLGAYKNILKAELSPSQLLAMVRYELEA